MSGYFITATGTGIGKTFVTCALAYQAQQAGREVHALKPLISGFSPDDATSDTSQLLLSLGQPVNEATIARISPWRFAAPLAPSMAAQKQGQAIDVGALSRFCQQPRAGLTLIEGVGGVMVPINGTYTTLDWMAELNLPIILITGSYLGSISHTLTAITALQSRYLALHALIISESEGAAVPLEDMYSELRKFLPLGAQVIKIPRIANAGEPWKHTASLAPLIL